MGWPQEELSAIRGPKSDCDEPGKLPTTLEEFMKAERLNQWPYKLSLEDPLDIQGEGLLLGTQEDVAEILRESAPLGLGLLDDLEEKLKAVEVKLTYYAEYIVTDDKRPSRLAERLFHSPSRTFMTEMSNSDAVKSHYSSRGHKSADFADTLMETKKRSLDYCMFPGFRHGELVELPAQLEAPPLLHRITNVQKFNPGFRKFWKKLFLSEASAAIMQDAFWWIFLDQFNNERGLEEEKDLLFDRISDSYVALFTSINTDVKDKFLSVYPDCLAQSIFSAYLTAFPESLRRFDDDFKQYLVNLTHQWVQGLKPVPGTWNSWDVKRLESDGTEAKADALAATKKMMEAAALNKKMDVRLDLDAFNKLVSRLGEETQDTPQPEFSKGAGGPSQSRQAIIGPKASKLVVEIRESHLVGPGPEYERVMFNTNGRSPLISHYLHMRQLRDYRQPGIKVRRTEISRLPPPGETYQEYIQNTRRICDNLTREYTKICQSTNHEIRMLEKKKRQMNRSIDMLQQELSQVKKSGDRKAVFESMEFIKEREREATPLLDTRPQSAATSSAQDAEDVPEPGCVSSSLISKASDSRPLGLTLAASLDSLPPLRIEGDNQ